MALRDRYRHLSTPERLERLEKAQRLHEWIIVAAVIFTMCLASLWLPDLYCAIH